jgi:hypothetical protein
MRRKSWAAATERQASIYSKDFGGTELEAAFMSRSTERWVIAKRNKRSS